MGVEAIWSVISGTQSGNPITVAKGTVIGFFVFMGIVAVGFGIRTILRSGVS